MDRTCRAETQRNAALTLIGRFLKTFSQIRGVPQQWFSSQSLELPRPSQAIGPTERGNGSEEEAIAWVRGDFAPFCAFFDGIWKAGDRSLCAHVVSS